MIALIFSLTSNLTLRHAGAWAIAENSSSFERSVLPDHDQARGGRHTFRLNANDIRLRAPSSGCCAFSSIYTESLPMPYGGAYQAVTELIDNASGECPQTPPSQSPPTKPLPLQQHHPLQKSNTVPT